MAALTLSERVDKIYDIKQQLRTELLFKGYSETEADNMLEKYPDLVRRIHGKNMELPQWFKDSVVCWYDVERQGCTNENMKAMQTRTGRAKLLDLSGNGLDMDLFGFNWGSDSGVDEGLNFSGFKIYHFGDSSQVRDFHCTRNSLSFTSLSSGVGGYSPTSLSANERLGFRHSGKKNLIKVSKLSVGATLTCDYFFKDSKELKTYRLCNQNGIYELPDPGDFANIYFRLIFTGEAATVLIEPVPAYENALVFDGVDDYGSNTHMPKLQDFTVIAKRKYINTSTKTMSCFSLKGDGAGQSPKSEFVFEVGNYVVSLGKRTDDLKVYDYQPISFMTKQSYNGNSILSGTNNMPGNVFLIGKNDNWTARFNGALYSLLLFKRTLSSDEIDWVKYNLMGEELPKPIAGWTAKGRHNNEPVGCREILPDVTGNGHHIQLKNFAFKYMSGFGGYDLLNSGLTASYNSNYVNLDKKNGVVTITNSGFKFDYGYLAFDNIESQKEMDLYQKYKIKVSGIPDSVYGTLAYTYNIDDSHKMEILKDGIYQLERFIFVRRADVGFRIFATPSSNFEHWKNLKIEFLPLYPDGLVFDGVDDYGVCENMPILQPASGFTIIAKRKYLELKPGALITNTIIVDASGSTFMLEGRSNSNQPRFGSFGGGTQGIPQFVDVNGISFMTSETYNNVYSLNKGNNNYPDNHNLYVGVWYQPKIYMNGVFYEAYFFDHDLTPSAIEAFVRKNMDSTYVLPKN